MRRVTKVPNIFTKKIPVSDKVTYLYGLKLIDKWSMTCQPDYENR